MIELMSSFFAGLIAGTILLLFVMLPPSARVLMLSKKKPLFILQDPTRKIFVVSPKSIDGTKYETKKLIFDIGNSHASNLDGRKVYFAYTGYGGAVDSLGVCKASEALHKELNGGELDPRTVLPLPSIKDGFQKQVEFLTGIYDERVKQMDELLKTKNAASPEVAALQSEITAVSEQLELKQMQAKAETGLFRFIGRTKDDGEIEYVAVGAELPSHGIVDLAAIRHFMLTNMPAITLKQYSIAQTALQKLSAMVMERKDWFKYFMVFMVAVIVLYLIKTLFAPGGSIDLGAAARAIPGVGGIGGR
mgnify:CR=1 FL=1